MKKELNKIRFLLMAFLMTGIVSCKEENDPIDISISVPSISTSAVSEISLNSAKCGGTITSNGGALVSARGVCWSTSQNPTIENDTTVNGQNSGIFTSLLTGLTSGTTYYVRAYATNSEGTGYGNKVSFTTLQEVFPVTDIDGNVYQSVQIGTQIWMAENLKTTHYNNGESLGLVSESTAWSNLTTEAFCKYANNESNGTIYGLLYNGFAIADSRNICPQGWHVPTDIEWNILRDYLGGELEAGGKMKEAGLNHWAGPNTGANNSSGFSALPGGIRLQTGSFSFIEYSGYFWSSSPFQANDLYCFYLLNNSASLLRNNYHKNSGLSVRCVKE